MKFNVPSKQLLTRLTAVSKVISNKNAYAILDNFLFELESERLVITGSDMETRMTTSIEVPGAEGSGRFAIDVKRILSLLKELPDTAMTFDINDESLEVNITYLNGKFNAMAFNGDEYPLKAQSNGETATFNLTEKDICDGIQKTLFAVGTDDMHPQFMGIYWDIVPDGITFVASDSHKLVRSSPTGRCLRPLTRACPTYRRPKLPLLQRVAASLGGCGIPRQWSLGYWRWAAFGWSCILPHRPNSHRLWPRMIPRLPLTPSKSCPMSNP